MIRPSAKHGGLIVYGRVKRRVVRLKFREIFGSVDGPLSVKAARFLSQAKKKKF
jgi:hypothetical protein